MKLDAKGLRFLSKDEFRILTAAEMGSKNHEVVPYGLIASIAGLKHGMAARSLEDLQRYRLLKREQNVKYDGYRLTYGGYDYLALKTLVARGTLRSIGQQIGIGKESDVYVVSGIDVSELEKQVEDADKGPHVPNTKSRYERLQEKKNDEENRRNAAPECFFAIKIHRLGRTSFRNIKNTRDYLINRKHSSWMYLSRLAAMKEFAFMQALYTAGFPVPRPIDFNRHCVVMELLRHSIPLNHLHEEDFGDVYFEAIEQLYDDLMALIIKFARHGLIHGDFNEFNIMISFDEELEQPELPSSDPTEFVNTNQRQRPKETRFGRPIVIDFPQMVSTRHENAKDLFQRDVACIQRFFEKRFKYVSERAPQWNIDVEHEEREINLDENVQASGYGGKEKDEDSAAWSMYLSSRKREEEMEMDNNEDCENNTSVYDNDTDDCEHSNSTTDSSDGASGDEADEDTSTKDITGDDDEEIEVEENDELDVSSGPPNIELNAIIGKISLEDDDDDDEEEEEAELSETSSQEESVESKPKVSLRISSEEIQRRVKRALKKEEDKKSRRQKERNKLKTKEQRQNQAAVSQNWTGW